MSGKESDRNLPVGDIKHQDGVIQVTNVRPATFVDNIRMQLPDYLEAIKLGLRFAYESSFPIPLKYLVKHHRLLAVGFLAMSGLSYGAGTYLDNQTMRNIALSYLSGGMEILVISLGVRFVSSKLHKN